MKVIRFNNLALTRGHLVNSHTCLMLSIIYVDVLTNNARIFTLMSLQSVEIEESFVFINTSK